MMFNLFLLVLLLQAISCYCQPISFNIRRYEDGDEVASSLTSANYCSAIHGYLDGSQCKCDYRLTFSLDLLRCTNYYNVPRFRFSRLGLADVSVSVVNIINTTDDGVEQYALQFTVSPDTPLPLAEGLGNNPLPIGCSVSSLELNTPSGWVMNNFSGFSLVERNSASYLQVNELPTEGFEAQFVRLNITCPNSVAGSLMFKFGGSQTFPIDVCEPNPCQNGGSCVNSLGRTPLCFCREDFAGEFCDMPTDDINDRCICDNVNDDGDDDDRRRRQSDANNGNGGNSNTDNRTCSSFSIIRRDDGDRVNTPLSSVEYCRSIRAYCPDGSCSYCQCEFRLTYRHDLQRCDDYYNECPLRFSRLTLNVDTGVSTVGFAENAEGFEITFEATSFPLPIVQGPADFHLPTECIVSSLAVNRAAGWRIIDHVGFNLSQINTSDTFLQIHGTPSLGVPFFDSELVRLNITCQGTSYGCLPMKFRSSGDPKNSSYCTSTDPCSRNPCNNGGSCTATGNSFNCSCPPNYSGPLCEDFDHCSTQPCMNGGSCTDEIDGYSCTCVEGFTGDNCNGSDCPCMNGGTCSEDSTVADGGNFVFCICPEGFTGDNCEIIIIIGCADDPCINGSCTDEVNGYTCVCDFGYTGTNCDEDMDECSIEDPCANGVCVNTIGSFMCDCEAGFMGTYCAEAICTDPCINGGTCIDPDVCQCPEPYGGVTCADIVCNSDFCANGGTCEVSLVGLTCSCLTGFGGERCETRNSAVSGRANQDEEAQTATAVGVSVGLVVVLVGATALIIIAIIVYTKYYSKKLRKPDIEQDSSMENPTYGSNRVVTNNSDEGATNEAVYEAVPDNDDVVHIQDHNETAYDFIS